MVVEQMKMVFLLLMVFMQNNILNSPTFCIVTFILLEYSLQHINIYDY
jgi:hypothetical protein